jgi:hypothetical protein
MDGSYISSEYIPNIWYLFSTFSDFKTEKINKFIIAEILVIIFVLKILV